MACWANLFAEEPLERPCWASFFAEMRLERLWWANLFAEEALERPCWANKTTNGPKADATSASTSSPDHDSHHNPPGRRTPHSNSAHNPTRRTQNDYTTPQDLTSHRASFDATRSRTGPSIGGVSPSIRSYAHLVVAGCGRPHWPQQPTPQRKALTKGKCLPVKAVTSLDNGRKWRVSAGRTLELLR